MATAVAAGITITAIASSGAGPAGAATPPKAQSVGRFLDGSVGGNPLQSLADVKDARAKSPGSQSVQNPLDVNLLDALDVPLTGALKLPSGGLADLGAANQVAVAKRDGYSYGGSGAVSNSGGVSLGSNDKDFPANATLNLNPSALSGNGVAIPALPTIPGLPAGLPTGGTLDSLGGITASIGAVNALAQTKAGGAAVTPHSSIASVNLTIGSPALGALLGQLKGLSTVLTTSLSAVPGLTEAIAALSAANKSKCALTDPTADLSLAGGGVDVDVSDGSLTINLGKLLDTLLGQDIANLSTSNFDLVSFLVTNLPKILSAGLTNLVTSITTPLTAAFNDCLDLLPAPLPTLVQTAVGLLTTGQNTLVDALGGLSDQFSSAATAPLGTLASGLENLLDIGLNVQSGPGSQTKSTAYPFTSALSATPDQATPVVKNQTVVRAIEIDLLDTGALGNLPKLPTFAAAAKGAGVALALGNAAAGPSTAAAPSTPSTTAPSTTPAGTPSTAIPTGVPAGEGRHGGSPVLPIVLGLLVLTLAGGGVVGLRARGKLGR